MHPLLKSHILFYSNGLAIYHGFSDIRPIEVNIDRLSAILKSIEFKISHANLPQRPQILFYNNSLAISHGLPNIGHVKVNNGR